MTKRYHEQVSVSSVWRLGVLFSLLWLAGCSSMYYATMEKLGIEKRDIMVDRVEDARDAQHEAQDTFRSSLERFQQVVDVPDTPLKAKYEQVREAYEQSEAAADEVHERIDAVQDVAEALFDEWQDELSRYDSASLRRSSERQLKNTEHHYQQLMKSMRQAEDRMTPVLSAFEDQMLFLKHNLNAQAIGALEGELGHIRQDVDQLIRQMEVSIKDSEAFIQQFRSTAQ
ncbi:DNA repair protein [Terasakiispira papahanaumokuakeensis]|uniref:DNA repair protein n=1 Tax=Terasakiispira papahanaumokuakeensis TaxID=197479 RepID=A0A1E2VFK2_9GAMM|nr:DNA repair protein [Terasakiispira papahanaumokuakeensis]